MSLTFRNPTFLFLFIFMISFSNASNATLKSGFRGVKKDIVIVARAGVANNSEAAKKGHQFLHANSLFSEQEIQSRIEKYIQANASEEIKTQATFHKPQKPWDWPVSKNTMIIQVRYAAEYLDPNMVKQPIVIFTVEVMFPEFDDPNQSVFSPYKVSNAWTPMVPLYIEQNVEDLDEKLDVAISLLIEPIVSDLFIMKAKPKPDPEFLK